MQQLARQSFPKTDWLEKFRRHPQCGGQSICQGTYFFDRDVAELCAGEASLLKGESHVVIYKDGRVSPYKIVKLDSSTAYDWVASRFNLGYWLDKKKLDFLSD